MSTELWMATGNAGKLKEMERLLDIPGVQLHHQGELSAFTPRPETGETFAENAMIKVKSLGAVRNKDWVIGEDSGLVVEGLNGLPGIHSARYAGDKASDAENVAKLLKMMQIRCNLNRKAHFFCALVVRSPEGELYTFEGKIDGTISAAQKGSDGFGYDPVFVPEGEEQTFAELGVPYKIKNSHRTRAVAQFKELLLEKGV